MGLDEDWWCELELPGIVAVLLATASKSLSFLQRFPWYLGYRLHL